MCRSVCIPDVENRNFDLSQLGTDSNNDWDGNYINIISPAATNHLLLHVGESLTMGHRIHFLISRTKLKVVSKKHIQTGHQTKAMHAFHQKYMWSVCVQTLSKHNNEYIQNHVHSRCIYTVLTYSNRPVQCWNFDLISSVVALRAHL